MCVCVCVCVCVFDECVLELKFNHVKETDHIHKMYTYANTEITSITLKLHSETW